MEALKAVCIGGGLLIAMFLLSKVLNYFDNKEGED